VTYLKSVLKHYHKLSAKIRFGVRFITELR